MIHVMSGIPGSGKSTHIMNHRQDGDATCSADHYFEDATGRYRFDPTKIGDAHNACMQNFFTYIHTFEQKRFHGASRMPGDMWVDNTGIRAWELAPYVALGAAFGHSVEIVQIRCDFEVARKRQTHGVPEYLLAMMYGDMRREILPPHWTVRVVEV